jgi:hypothetical protein
LWRPGNFHVADFQTAPIEVAIAFCDLSAEHLQLKQRAGFRARVGAGEN